MAQSASVAAHRPPGADPSAAQPLARPSAAALPDQRARQPRLPTWSLLAGWLAALSLRLGLFRGLALRFVLALFRELAFVEWFAPSRHPERRALFCRNLLATVTRGLRQRRLGLGFLARWVALLLVAARHERRVSGAYRRREGRLPPAFLVLSPGGECNLRCAHCYAAQGRGRCRQRLERALLDRIIEEQRRLWGSSLVIVSGGEPLLYRDDQGGLLELIEAHPRTLFIVYSNGTLVDAQVARRLARAGNATLMLSVEGLEAETDRVRGRGAHRSVLRAMEALRGAGLLFGVSITATRRNLSQLGGAELYRHYVDREGASFCWILERAAQGRAGGSRDLLDLKEKTWLSDRLARELHQRGRLVVDFLHTPRAGGGCMGAGRTSGFFAIDWRARVQRCVYSPGAIAELRELYARGEDLDALTRLPASCVERQLERAFFRAGEEAFRGEGHRPCPALRFADRARGAQAAWRP